MTDANKFSVQFKGGGPEGDLNTQVAFDQVVKKIDDIETRIPEKVTGEESEGENLVPLEATINRNLDPQGRLLNVSGKIPQGKGPVRYRLFTNDVNVAGRGEILAAHPFLTMDKAVRLCIGKQWDQLLPFHASTDSLHFRRVELNVFMGVAYNVPWHGGRPPTTYSGPFINGSAPRCGEIWVNQVSAGWANALSLTGSGANARDYGIMGNWDFHSGGLSANHLAEINSATGDTYVKASVNSEIPVQWGCCPFFFGSDEEDECKKFLEDVFYCAPNGSSGALVDGVPGAATGIGDGFVQACLTSSKSFPILVWSKLVFGSKADLDLDRSVNWTVANDYWPGNLDVDRPKWSVDVLGSQDIVVT